jgi:hypothetical protein
VAASSTVERERERERERDDRRGRGRGVGQAGGWMGMAFFSSHPKTVGR